jgi:hypothetical protein
MTVPAPLSARSAAAGRGTRRLARLALAAAAFGLCAGGTPPPQTLATQRVRELAEPLIERHLSEAQADAADLRSRSRTLPALGKPGLVTRALDAPWDGLAQLESSGRAMQAASAEAVLAGALETLDRPGALEPVAPGQDIATLLDAADQARDAALTRLSEDEREFLLEHAGEWIERFHPISRQNREKDWKRVRRHHRFVELARTRLDLPSLARAAVLLLAIERVPFPTAAPEPGLTHPRVLGPLVAVHPTAGGAILIGGPESNHYRLDASVRAVIDVGGNDLYEGAVGASAADRGNVIVIDVAGDDLYRSSAFGLATGRLGVGVLIDRAGDDRYELAPGSGATAFAGVGVLIDRAGNDEYRGSKYTQGAAVAGIAILLDGGGNDVHNADGYAIACAGASGFALLRDASGNDTYGAGGKFESGYRGEFDAWALGIGVGKYIYSRDETQARLALGGGVAMLLDSTGNDTYQGTTFAIGTGYFFGAGLLLDGGGDDRYAGAHYGHAGGPHYAVGLFIDDAGRDTYTSIGGGYNAGCAWDRSVMMFVDARGDDTYEFARTDGMGRADTGGWGLFADLAGDDRYAIAAGMGLVRDDDRAIAGFLDAGGRDDYAKAPQRRKPDNGARHFGPRAFFVDLPD